MLSSEQPKEKSKESRDNKQTYIEEYCETWRSSSAASWQWSDWRWHVSLFHQSALFQLSSACAIPENPASEALWTMDIEHTHLNKHAICDNPASVPQQHFSVE